MTRALILAAPVVLLVLLATEMRQGCAQPPIPDPPPRAFDTIVFAASRPLLVRLHISLDGVTGPMAFERFLDKLFAYLDTDANGRLSEAEWSRAPNVAQLVAMLESDTFEEVSPAPEYRSAARPEITPTAMRAYFRDAGLGPVVLAVGRPGAAPEADRPGTLLWARLDRDGDGKLSRAEVDEAAAALRRLDENEDGMVSVIELAAGRRPPEIGAVFAPLSPGDEEVTVRLNIGDAKPADRAAPLMRRYDGDKDGRLTVRELGLPMGMFAPLAERGTWGPDQLCRWLDGVPDIELAVRLGRERHAEPVAELSAARRRERLPGVELARDRDGVLVLRLAGEEVTFLAGDVADSVRLARGEYCRRFTSADVNRDGVLGVGEIQRPPFEWIATWRLADRDGDDRLTRAEVEAFAELHTAALAGVAVLTGADRGPSVFELIDADHDARLGPRDLLELPTRLRRWDRDGDGNLTRAELPSAAHVVLSHGLRSSLTPRQGGEAAVPGYGPAYKSPRRARGPLWFRKMDANGDGDVSPAEFLGSREVFRKLDLDSDGLLSVEEAEKADKAG